MIKQGRIFGVLSPCWATPPSSWSSCVRAHEQYHCHDNHEKINLWVSFSLLYEYGAPLGGPSGRRSFAIIAGSFWMASGWRGRGAFYLSVGSNRAISIYGMALNRISSCEYFQWFKAAQLAAMVRFVSVEWHSIHRRNVLHYGDFRLSRSAFDSSISIIGAIGTNSVIGTNGMALSSLAFHWLKGSPNGDLKCF